MKKTILTIALAIGMAIPLTVITESVKADPWYTVNTKGTTLWQHSFGRGSVRCHIEPGATVNRHWGENWARWIYVRVTTFPRNWNCRGWVDKHSLSPHVNDPNEWYVVVNPKGALMRDQPQFGYTTCHIAPGRYLHRGGNRRSANNDSYIISRWKITRNNTEMERDFKDKRGRHCSVNAREGWVRKSDLRPVNPLFQDVTNTNKMSGHVFR